MNPLQLRRFLVLVTSWDGELSIPHKSLQGNQDSSHNEGNLMVFLELGWEAQIPLHLRH